jgi:hypothetical protein
VYQFARDAAVAEAWLIAQEPYLMSQELGVSYSFLALLNDAVTNTVPDDMKLQTGTDFYGL